MSMHAECATRNIRKPRAAKFSPRVEAPAEEYVQAAALIAAMRTDEPANPKPGKYDTRMDPCSPDFDPLTW